MTRTTNVRPNPDPAVIARAATRLRQSREEWEREQSDAGFDAGFDAGMQWATDEADHAELRNLQQLRDSLATDPVHDWDWYFEDHEDSAFDVSERVATVILYGLDVNVDRTAAKELWPSLGITDNPTGHWLKGFCLGATTLFEAVAD